MKKIILNAVIITVSALFFGCVKNTPEPTSIVSTSNKVDYSNNKIDKLDMRTLYWVGDIQDYTCSTPPKNCFPDFIVSSIDVKIIFTNLNEAIKNNNQELFFATNNYSTIFNTDFEFQIQDGLEKGHLKFIVSSSSGGNLSYLIVKPQHEKFTETQLANNVVRAYPVVITN